jgi:hypothetical protein
MTLIIPSNHHQWCIQDSMTFQMQGPLKLGAIALIGLPYLLIEGGVACFPKAIAQSQTTQVQVILPKR